jgi:hypothetical protein
MLAVATKTKGRCDSPPSRCALTVGNLLWHTSEGWWTARGSNPRPPHCERGALPTELAAHVNRLECSLARLIVCAPTLSLASRNEPPQLRRPCGTVHDTSRSKVR